MDPVLERLRAELTGRYEVEQELGRGGMAVVYLAKDLRHERRVAIKVLRSDLGSSGSERFLREIRTVAQLHHPHIVALHDSGSVDGHLFYVMPYVEGETLREKLEREGQLPVDDAVRITREVADALDYAHGRGIVHRDIKPENIFLSGGHALVADFGIARAADAAKQGGDTTLTDAGLAVGTPAYMSPEQATADPRIDGRSDQYALGCVLYEMLAGQPPFTGPTSQAVMARHTADAVPPLRTVRAVPVHLESAIVRALAKVPADRWSSTKEFAASLGANASTESRPSVRSKHNALTAAAGIAAVAALLWAGYRSGFISSLADTNGGPAATTSVRKLALLPMSTSSHEEHRALAAGLTLGLNVRLFRVQGLYLLEGVERFRDAEPLAAGKELGAHAVLATNLQAVGNMFRVTARLVDVETRQTLFTTQFQGELVVNGKVGDPFTLQDALADSIIAAMVPQLSAAQRSTMTRGDRTRDAEAYRLFLEAVRIGQTDISTDGATQAMGLLRQAIARDSNYADAWAELASWYTWYGLHADQRPADVAIAWRAGATRALELDPEHAAAHNVLGDLRVHFDWDIAGGLASMRRAVDLNPANSAWAFIYGVNLGLFGQHDSALVYARRGVVLDSLAAFPWNILGKVYAFAGERDSAIRASERSLAIDSTMFHTNFVLMNAYLDAGRRSDAERSVERLIRHAQGNQNAQSLAAHYFRRAGDTTRARQLLADVTAESRKRYVPPSVMAAARLAVGDKQGALTLLEDAANIHDLALIEQLVYGFGSLAGDPRYEAIRKRVFGAWRIPRNPFP